MLIGARLLPIGVAVIAVTVVVVIVVSFISSALSQIFRVAVYQYAVSGEAAVFPEADLRSAIAPRKRR